MRKIHLIKKILKSYKGYIKYIEEHLKDANVDQFSTYLRINNILFGVCFYIDRELKLTDAGYHAKWV